ncbi:hypothetical protein LWI29_000759 [Acer saccharum]|uniref:Uncharacterized protein n=1 Tax=Acer saccharum TaxID=4024 RepID=A0AA39SYK5_ACESA|nr:hypothetical protein LWI29_000759 [Acer saccharum]
MGSLVYNKMYLSSSRPKSRVLSSSSSSTRISFACSSSSSSEIQVSKRPVLQQIDKELINGNDREALSLVRDLQGKPGGLRCFGAARQVPQRLYTLDELKLNGIDTSSLLSPVDETLGSIERNLQLAAVSGGVAAWNVFDFNPQQIFHLSLALLFLWTSDSVSFNGGIGSLVIDTIGHTFSRKYHNRVIQLDVILQGLGFTQKKADSQVGLSVLNTVLLLRRHEGARAKLAEAMTMGKSVGSCIEIIEDTIDEADI